MPISVTCQCGARLEIDEKFLGKEIQCPDCQRPLPTKAPPTPPPLDLPDFRRISGLAVLSLTLALVGAFTIVGTLAAVVVGFLALKQIAGKAGKLEGINLARAGIAIGIAFTVITSAALVSPFVFGVDQFFRELALAKRTDRTIKEIVSATIMNTDISMKRPSKAWGLYASSAGQNSAFSSDPLILVNIADDSYAACQDIDVGDPKDDDATFKNVIDRVKKSELINLVGRLGRNSAPEPTIVEKKPVGADGVQELIVDMRLGGQDRRLLIQYKTKAIKLYFFVGCARTSRFERAQKDFREALSQFKAI